jgi:hypothetical protein
MMPYAAAVSPRIRRLAAGRAWVWGAALGAISLTLTAACEDAFPADGSAPRIDAVRPSTAPPGAAVTVIGINFGLRGPDDRVLLAGADMAVESWTDTAVLARVPADARSGSRPLVMRAGAWVSRPWVFRVAGEEASGGAEEADAGPSEDAAAQPGGGPEGRSGDGEPPGSDSGVDGGLTGAAEP